MSINGRLRDTVWVFLLLALLYGYFGLEPQANGNSRLALVFAVVHEGRLTIDSYHDLRGVTATIDKSFHDGHYYSDKAIGTAVAGVVVYAPLVWVARWLHVTPAIGTIKWILTFFVVGLPSALAGALMFRMARTVTESARGAFAAVLAIYAGTLVFPYSALFYGHALAGALLTLALFLLFRVRHLGAAPDARGAFALGLVLGGALITEYPTALLVLPLGLLFLHTLHAREPAWSDRLRSLSALAAGAVLPLTLMFTYNNACFGGPLSLGYAHEAQEQFQQSMGAGFFGIHPPRLDVLFYLTAHPAAGLLWQSPVLILVPWGAARLFKESRYRAELLVVAVGVVSFLFMNAGYDMWWGGWAVGPRHLVPALPLLCLPLACAARRRPGVFLALVAVSLFQMGLATASDPHVPLPDDWTDRLHAMPTFWFSTIYGYCWLRVKLGLYAPNLGQVLFGLQRSASVVPLIVAGLGLSARVWGRKQ